MNEKVTIFPGSKRDREDDIIGVSLYVSLDKQQQGMD